MDNAIYMSPHHERYFVPSALPQVEPEEKKQNDTTTTKLLDVCAIGSTGRRKWELMIPFFKNPNNTKYFDKIRIRILGHNGMPKLLKKFFQNNNNKTMENSLLDYQLLQDDRKFYAAIQACGVIILPIARDTGFCNHYFKSPPDSKWKLSGSIPPIIAYQKPFVLPQELLELYHKELPLHLPHRGYNDEIDTAFAEALTSLLDDLLWTRRFLQASKGDYNFTNFFPR